MKLIIQIPCFNEEKTLPQTVNSLPKKIKGIHSIEYLVINDGSTDKTIEAARKLGVHHIVDLKQNHGLVHAFFAGLDAALSLGADIIINTDADNQYDAACIPDLLAPLLNGDADIVVGERPIEAVPYFSGIKKKLQRFGSYIVGKAAGVSIPDATSGFRAYTRNGAMRLNKLSDFTYTLETIIQAGRKHIPVKSVRVSVNPRTRESRLFKSIPSYIKKSVFTIFRLFVVYKPLRFFLSLGTLFLLPGLFLGGRFLVYYFQGNGGGHVQSLILTAILLLTGFLMFVLGVVAELIATNRRLLEEINFRVKRVEYDGKKK